MDDTKPNGEPNEFYMSYKFIFHFIYFFDKVMYSIEKHQEGFYCFSVNQMSYICFSGFIYIS